MRLLVTTLLIALGASQAHAAKQSEMSKQLRDWWVACDNLRVCMAFGFGADGDERAHLRITRGAEAQGTPEITVALVRDNAETQLRLSFNEPSLGGLPNAPLPVQMVGDDTVVATLPYSETLLASLRKAETITVEEVGEKPSEHGPVKISLSGAAASFLFMDEQQKRVGTVTALAARGGKPASAVPAPPKMPIVRVAKPYESNAPLPKAPPKAVLDAVRKFGGLNVDGADAAEPIAARLSATKTLWGVAIDAPASGPVYALYVVENGRVKPAELDDPAGRRDPPNHATQPQFDPATNILRIDYRQRSLSDCGGTSEWGWDGSKFRLINRIFMDECRGVRSERWPADYRARREQAER